MSLNAEKKQAEVLYRTLWRFEDTLLFKRLMEKVRDMGSNRKFEEEQFYELYLACKESQAFNTALMAAGFGDIASLDPYEPSAVKGRIIQTFNRMLEDFVEAFQ